MGRSWATKKSAANARLAFRPAPTNWFRCSTRKRRRTSRNRSRYSNRSAAQGMTAKPKEVVRCAWAGSELSVRYHDEEWGVPVHDDHTLFEFLILEGAQAGLSWNTILNKREAYRTAFDGFDPKLVARYDRRK